MFLCKQFVGLCYSCISQKNSYRIIISLYFILKAPKISLDIQVENRVTVFFRNFNFEPSLTLHARFSLLRVGIMHAILKSKNQVKKGFNLSFF